MDRDVIIQRYLTGRISDGERKWLLDNLLSFYNGVLTVIDDRARLRKGGQSE